MVDAAAFDPVAARYDRAFTYTPLGRLLRRRVWRILAEEIRPGQRVLELACGTGEDVVWLAQQGVEVVATDGAGKMVQIARQKAEAAGVAGAVTVHHCSLQQVSGGQLSWAGMVDGVFSNFGGLNTLGAWRPLARSLAQQVRPGGWLLLVVMGPVCPWEIGWHLLHGQARRAARRMRAPAVARVGGRPLPVWYPSPRRLAQAFAPWFRPCRTYSLGLWLPPTYLGHLVAGRPRLAATLNRIEQVTARVSGGWGDHYILRLRRSKDEQRSR